MSRALRAKVHRTLARALRDDRDAVDVLVRCTTLGASDRVVDTFDRVTEATAQAAADDIVDAMYDDAGDLQSPQKYVVDVSKGSNVVGSCECEVKPSRDADGGLALDDRTGGAQLARAGSTGAEMRVAHSTIARLLATNERLTKTAVDGARTGAEMAVELAKQAIGENVELRRQIKRQFEDHQNALDRTAERDRLAKEATAEQARIDRALDAVMKLGPTVLALMVRHRLPGITDPAMQALAETLGSLSERELDGCMAALDAPNRLVFSTLMDMVADAKEAEKKRAQTEAAGEQAPAGRDPVAH